MPKSVIARTEPRVLSGAMMVAVDDVSKSFGGTQYLPIIPAPPRTHVFHDVSFSLASGDIMVLRGANGSGKTTLLKIIAGLVSADSGSVAFSSPGEPSIGFSPGEERSLFWRISAQDNLEFFGGLRGLTRWQARMQSAQLLAALGLPERASVPVRALSSGQRQRLLVARALMGDPAVLLLDEPTGHMDPESVRRVWDVLHERAAGGTAIVLATHRDEDEDQAHIVATLTEGSLQVGQTRRASRPSSELGSSSRTPRRPMTTSALQSSCRRGWAFFRRDFVVARSYPVAFLLQFTGTIVGGSSLFFLSKIVPSGSHFLRPYGGGYLGFALLGMAAAVLQSMVMYTVSSGVREGQLTGTLEAMLSTPASMSSILVGSSLWPTSLALLNTVVLLVFGVAVLGVRFPGGLYPVALVALTLGMLATLGVGFVEAAVILLIKRGTPVNTLLMYLTNLLGGILYPVALLPLPLLWISYLLPVTHMANALRFGLLAGNAGRAIPALAALAVLSAVYLGVGILGLRAAFRVVRRQGSLGQY